MLASVALMPGQPLELHGGLQLIILENSRCRIVVVAVGSEYQFRHDKTEYVNPDGEDAGTP